MVVKYTVKLDLTDNGCFNTGWRIKQGDFKDSMIVVKVTDNDVPYYDADNMPRIIFKRADGKSIIGTMSAGGNSNYQYSFIGNELQIAGPVVMDVKFGGDETSRTSTASCSFTCVEDTINGEATPADIYPGITLADVDTEATRVAQKVAKEALNDIKLISLTSSSPLSSSSASNILGLDALGKSTQQTTDLVNPKDTTYNNCFYNGNGVYTSVSKWRILYTPCVVGQKFKIEGLKAYNSSGIAVATEVAAKGGNGTTLATRDGSTSYEVTTTINGYMGITVAYDASASLGEEVSTVKVSTTPTPTSPISIVDASKDVTAHTVNLVNQPTVGKNWNGVASASNGYYEVAVESGKTYTVSYNNNDGITMLKLFTFTADSVASYTSLYDLKGNLVTHYTFTVPSGSTRARVLVGCSGTMTADIMASKKVQIEQGTIATDYVAYQSNKITLPYTLRSVGTVKDELVVNEDGTGKLIRRVGTVTYDGSYDENWQQQSASGLNGVFIQLPIAKKTSQGGKFLCNLLKCTEESTAGFRNDNTVSLSDSGNLICTFPTSISLSDWKTLIAQTNMILLYQLSTPTETTLTSTEVASILSLKTYNGTTIVDSEVDAEVTYAGDVKSYIDGKFDYLYELIRSYHPEEEISVLSEVSDDE